MINLSNIINSSIIKNPWEHQVVDDFLTKESFNILTTGGKILPSKALHEPRDPNGIWMFDAEKYGVPSYIIDHIMKINIELLKKNSILLSGYSNAMHSKIGYFSIPRYNFIGPHVNGTIHDEGSSKTMSMVIYLMPKKTFGTRLYSTKMYESFVKEIEWKKNRAFLMCSQPGITWHSFHSDNSSRMTINFYYERMENMSYINTLSEEKRNWFYENLANNNLYVNL
jgi:hypothetical protein